MIFFRTHQVSFQFQEKIFFGKVKAYFSASVDPLSGMTVNLKDVDVWMKRTSASSPVFKNTNQILEYYFKDLRKQSPEFIKVKIGFSKMVCEYDGEKTVYSYKTSTWFSSGKTWVQRPIRLQTEIPLSKIWLRKLSRKRWSSPEALFRKLKTLIARTLVEVEYPEANYRRRLSI